MPTVVHDAESANDSAGGAGRPLLDEIVRDGARQMLHAALKAEVAAYIDAHCHLVDEDGHRLVVSGSCFLSRCPTQLIPSFTAALEHIQASLNLNASLPPYLSEHA